MANNYFQFKQFTVKQDKCAMKVCTDSCLFGAYMAKEIEQHTVFNILDVGTGTGILSLMLAQKNNAAIDAVEIDEMAFEQAQENIQLSNYKKSVTPIHCSINDFFPNYLYDFVISNPPFFEDNLISTNEKKNIAKHSSSLTAEQLLANIDRLLKNTGFFSLLLPFSRVNYFETKAKKLNYHPIKTILVKQTPEHNHFRAILIFSKTAAQHQTTEIIIKEETGNYSAEFTDLLKDYYLNL